MDRQKVERAVDAAVKEYRRLSKTAKGPNKLALEDIIIERLRDMFPEVAEDMVYLEGIDPIYDLPEYSAAMVELYKAIPNWRKLPNY